MVPLCLHRGAARLLKTLCVNMDNKKIESLQDQLLEKFIYVFFVGILAYLLTSKLFFLFFTPGGSNGFLLIFSLIPVFTLSALSFMFFKYYKAQSKVIWKLFIVFINSSLASIIGVLITYLYFTR